jgi:MurNAc alpha-1-phosphate uridylyltransferase
MLLAAGRGERMRPLTDNCPKPLLQVKGKPLLEWHLEALARAGVTRALINTAWLGAQIVDKFGDKFAFKPFNGKHEQLSNLKQMALDYSHEGHDFGGALETAGGVCRALPALCRSLAPSIEPVFWVLAGDVYVPGFDFDTAAVARFVASDKLAHLWLVPNPEHHLRGDFGLEPGTGLALNLPPDDLRPRYTYSTIGLYRRGLFIQPWCDIEPGNPQGIKAALAPLLRAAMDQGRVSAELYLGAWTDVGTPQRLAQLNGEPSLL